MEKKRVYLLTDNDGTYSGVIHTSMQQILETIEGAIADMTPEELSTFEWTIGFDQMTQDEIDELPEACL